MANLTGVLIGCGAMGREHLTALAELPSVEIAAVCDISAARAEATAERFGIARWYTNPEQLLADIRPDLVHITTPPASHFSIAKSCLDARLNVLCEKPITIDYAEFGLLRQLAADRGCMLLENQQMRFHSSVERIQDLVKSGRLGGLIDLQLCVSLNIVGTGSPYIDRNAAHFGMDLRGGAIGDFLPHIAYLAYMFTGPVSAVRTIWKRQALDTPLPADEFRGFIKGDRATAYVSFSGNARLNGFLIRVNGTQMHVEANLWEPPRLTKRKVRSGEPALMSLVDGITESRDVFLGTLAGFWRKLAGTSAYDGLLPFIAKTYRALEMDEAQPVSLQEIDEVARLVDSFTRPDLQL
jgi:predicted dehydrogenase